MLSINTNNYNINYNNILYLYKNYTTNYLVTEIYRTFLYKRFKKFVIKKRIEKNINNLDKEQFIGVNYLLDMVSLFIINHKFKSLFDPIFDSTTPFNKKDIDYFFSKKCIPTMNNDVINSLKVILPELSDKYIKYHNKLKKRIKIMNNIEYKINYELFDSFVLITLEIIKNEHIHHLNYKKSLKIATPIFNHLVKLYNTKMLNNFESNSILDFKVIEYIYMVFIRYNILSSGNNQASILPSFKKLIKDTLNIKIELFGSPINTSSFNFGSLFYDIDYVFGSIGNYFNTTLIKGNYEINPIFDKCLINNIVDKCLNELNQATENKYGLLFLFILPTSYNKHSSKLQLLDKYKQFETIISKKQFPYIRYDRKFSKTNVSAIVETHLIIFHTEYINNIVKLNVSNFYRIIKKWQMKKNK